MDWSSLFSRAVGYIFYSSLDFKSISGLFGGGIMYIYSYIQESLKYAKVMNREIQIKVTMKYYFTPTGRDILKRQRIGKGMENWNLHFGK